MELGTFQMHIEEMCSQREIKLEQAAEHAFSLGVDHICVGCGSDWRSKETTKALCSLGISVSDVFGNVNLITGKDISDSLKELLEQTAAWRAERLLITTEGYRDKDNPIMRQEDDRLVAEGLALAAEMAKQYGINIVVENYDMNEGPMTFGADLKFILEQAKNVRFAFDSGNFVHPGENTVENLRFLRRWLGDVVHFKDRRREKYLLSEEGRFHKSLDGMKYYPCPVGGGIIPFDEIKETLLETGFDGMILLEHFGASDQWAYLEKSADYVKSLFCGKL